MKTKKKTARRLRLEPPPPPPSLPLEPRFGNDRKLVQEMSTSYIICLLLSPAARTSAQANALRDEIDRRVPRPAQCHHFPHSSTNRTCVVCHHDSDKGPWLY